MNIQVSEAFVDGFVKAAADQGLTADEIRGLYKIATYMRAGAGRSDNFEAGVAEELEKSGQALPALARAGRTAGILGLLGLGGLGMYGAQKGLASGGEAIADQQLISGLEKQRHLQARHKTISDLTRAASPQVQPSMYGYGVASPY